MYVVQTLHRTKISKESIHTKTVMRDTQSSDLTFTDRHDYSLIGRPIYAA